MVGSADRDATAVLDALMVVTIVPLGRGNGGNKGFNPRAIRIDWK
jgi:hypothetical protein